VGDKVCPIDLECVEHTSDIVALGLLVVPALGTGGEPHPAQVGHNHGMVGGKLRREGNPHVAGLTITVKQDRGGSLTADPHMYNRPIRRNILGSEPGWKGLHICASGHDHIFRDAIKPGHQFSSGPTT
jgi:hypothetical protein